MERGYKEQKRKKRKNGINRIKNVMSKRQDRKIIEARKIKGKKKEKTGQQR